MVKYFFGIDHVNTTDDSETIITVESTSEETKTINEVRLTSETNAGKLEMFVDREGFYEAKTYHKTAQAEMRNWLVIPIERKLEPGEKFTINLQNFVAGVNAEITGSVVYEIE